MKHYLSEVSETLENVGSSGNGLSQAEAASRLERDGRNKLAEAKKPPFSRDF